MIYIDKADNSISWIEPEYFKNIKKENEAVGLTIMTRSESIVFVLIKPYGMSRTERTKSELNSVEVWSYS